jgi:threonine dehydratase
VAALQRAGADITCHGRDVVEAEIEARRVAERSGAVYCSPYNDLKVPMAAMAGLLTHGAAAVCGACRLQDIET